VRPRDRLLNRDLAWLNFNDRVLAEAADPTVPPLERLRFVDEELRRPASVRGRQRQRAHVRHGEAAAL
jgi:hypothetical protein